MGASEMVIGRHVLSSCCASISSNFYLIKLTFLADWYVSCLWKVYTSGLGEGSVYFEKVRDVRQPKNVLGTPSLPSNLKIMKAQNPRHRFVIFADN